MSEITDAMAKLAGIQRSLSDLIKGNDKAAQDRGRLYIPSLRHNEVGHYFAQTAKTVDVLREALPNLYGDFHPIATSPDVQMAPTAAGIPTPPQYSSGMVQTLARDITQVLEIRANSELEQPKSDTSPRRVFITHGNTDEWRRVQAVVEKDLGLRSIELAQEVNAGQTIIEKLFANADKCDSAVVVWTGDDRDEKGTPMARENVMHEIGFFQGKYGRGRVILLHEDGVNVPTNLSGLVYSPFPKGGIDASLYLLGRELRSIYGV
ncbi:MAG: nucleotide-binding protein [Burkholderiaceae bacterium]